MKTLLLEQPTFKTPFVVSLSNHEQPFDRLRANGLESIFVTRQGGLIPSKLGVVFGVLVLLVKPETKDILEF